MERTYSQALFDEWNLIIRDIARRIEQDLANDGARPFFGSERIPSSACPANIGNDPCDEWPSEWSWDEGDY